MAVVLGPAAYSSHKDGPKNAVTITQTKVFVIIYFFILVYVINLNLNLDYCVDS